jgi:hypothetical protein
MVDSVERFSGVASDLQSVRRFTMLAIIVSLLTSLTAWSAILPKVELETLDKEEFIFPDDLRAGSLNIVLLAISEEQDNGVWQGDALVDWYAAFEEQGVLSEDVMAWHFSVMKVPFFVKGFIRGGMAEDYEGKIPLAQTGPIFIKDVPEFAKEAGIEMDGQPNILLVAPNGDVLQAFKGEVSAECMAKVMAAIDIALPDAVLTAE